LRQERAGAIVSAREILDAADAEERGLTEEEQERYDGLMERVSDLAEDIERREGLMQMERELQDPVTPPVGPQGQPGDGAAQRQLEFVSRGLRSLNDREPDWGDEANWRDLFASANEANTRAFRRWLRAGESRTWEPELRAARASRALQVDSDEAGGYLVTPVQFVDRLIQAVDNLTYVRQWATLFSVPMAQSLGAPSLDADPADPTWTHELAIGSEDSTMDFGQRALYPHPLAKYIKVSRKLLRMVPDVESLVRERLGYKFSVVMENAYLNGDGDNCPLGVFTASDDGISTSRDVDTDMDTDAVTFDGLIECKYTLKAQYWGRARWLFHRDGVKQIAKLKDGEGQYVWRPNVRVGEPDTCLSFPVFMSEYAPSTFTTGEYVGLLGDWSYYWIADALDMEMQRLVELYAATNQVGIVGRMESDGMPVLEEAFVRVTLA
jgi:HK97 family phage major capsid protein